MIGDRIQHIKLMVAKSLSCRGRGLRKDARCRNTAAGAEAAAIRLTVCDDYAKGC